MAGEDFRIVEFESIQQRFSCNSGNSQRLVSAVNVAILPVGLIAHTGGRIRIELTSQRPFC